MVLRLEGGSHGGIGWQHPGADDGPVGLALAAEVIEVHRLVRAVEAADPDVNDGPGETGPVVARDGHPRIQRRQVGRREFDRGLRFRLTCHGNPISSHTFAEGYTLECVVLGDI